MRRLLTLIPAAVLLLAPLMTASNAGAEPVSTYTTKSYRDGGVVLRMNADKGSVLSPGEEISFTYQTSDDALVILFDIDTEGYVHLLHPYDGPQTLSRARTTYRVPAGGDKLLVSGETGMEFVFALTIPDRSALDEDELVYLREVENRPLEERYRIDGDPFLAANIIAGELIRGISHRDGVFLDYTYFYVNQRVDHPCYLCGECGGAESAICDDYQLVADFDRASPMTYPLARAYDAVERGTTSSDDDVQVADRQEVVEDDVNVSFYPYNVEVRYVTQPRAYAYDYYWYDWYDPFWYDPWYCGYTYYPSWRYPYYGHYYAWTFDWGYWGGYYCSGWYYPRYRYWRDYYHCNYWDYNYGSVAYKKAYRERSDYKYKSGSSGTLVATHTQSTKRGGSALRVGASELRRSSKTRVAQRDGRTAASLRTGKTGTRGVIGRTTVKTNTGRSITTDRGAIRGKSTTRVRTTDRSSTSRGTSKSTVRSRSGSTTRKSSAVKRSGSSRSSSKSSVKPRSNSSSRSGSKGTVRKKSSSSRSSSSSKSSSVKSSSSSRSSSKSTSSRSSSSGSKSKGGSRGKRK